eukprot:SAG25_NODE_129_length_14495_cov_41.326202_9_plen_98_part_00
MYIYFPDLGFCCVGILEYSGTQQHHLPAMQQISLIHDLLLAFMQSKNGFVGLQHVPGWTEIYSVVMSKKRALAFLIPLWSPISDASNECRRISLGRR